MYWNSCRPAGNSRARAELAFALFLAFAGLWAVPASGATQEDDPALRERLRAALAEPMAFEDRFAAQVWMTDMAGRLRNKVPDPEERIEILQAVHAEAARVQLPPEMILAVIDVESGFQRYAVSRANAQGLMQVMRFWLKELGMPGHALLDIRENVRMGCTILRYYYDQEHGNWTRALARYNGSPGSRTYPDLVYGRLRTRWFEG